MINLLIYFVFFAVIGVAHEVFWTSIFNYFKTKNLKLVGMSSLWMFPIYGGIVFIVIFVLKFFSGYPWWAKGFIYMFLIFLWEYVSGFILKKTIGVVPWDYSKGKGSKRYHLHGLICLEYAPVWFVEGLIAEWFLILLQNNLLL